MLNVLVVDDDAAVLEYVALTLRDTGLYSVITAPTGTEALIVARAFQGEIKVLLSDFEMPEMSGTELAIVLTAERPAIKVLLMSGFNEGMLVLNEGWHFLPKPFIASKLCGLVATLSDPDKPSRFAR